MIKQKHGNTKIYNRFDGYSLADCACKYCLHYLGKNFGCPLSACCCEEEKRLALRREREKKEVNSERM